MINTESQYTCSAPVWKSLGAIRLRHVLTRRNEAAEQRMLTYVRHLARLDWGGIMLDRGRRRTTTVGCHGASHVDNEAWMPHWGLRDWSGGAVVSL